jgi:small GTP-binding protein
MALAGNQRSIKVVFLGDSSVGKTSIISSYCRKQFHKNLNGTVGPACIEYPMTWQGLQVMFSIWDTAGQEKYRSLTQQYYRDAVCAVVTFSVSQKETLAVAESFINEVKNAVPQIIIVLCGNKVDKERKRVVPTSDGLALAHGRQVPFVETSAKTSQGLDVLFQTITDTIGSARPELMQDCVVGLKREVKNERAESHCC